jgi:hypothetical protein
MQQSNDPVFRLKNLLLLYKSECYPDNENGHVLLQIITNRTGRTYDLIRQSKLLITWKGLYKIRNYISNLP